MRQIEPRQFNNVVLLLAGIGAGLLLGLFIGWVVWPVEWQGATLNELFPTQKAEYLGAVADAYAIAHSPEAAELARQRVATLGDDLSDEMTAAIAHFSASSDPNREIRINNLSFLASALGISTPGLVGVTQNTQAESAPVSTAAVDVAAPVATESTAAPSWLAWLTYVLAGVLLLLAGLYLILRQRQQRQGGTQIGEHIDRQIGSLNQTPADPWERRTHSYVAAEDDPAYAMAATQDEWQQPTAEQLGSADEYNFDDEPEAPSHVRPGGGNWVGAKQGNHVTQFRLDEENNTAEEDDFGDEDEEAETPSPYRPPQNAPTTGRSIEPAINERPLTAEASTYSRPEGRPAFDARAQGALAVAPFSTAERPASLTRPANKQHKLLEIYTAQYQVGLHDYDESHPIMDPSAAKYIGECGMGTSTKNGLLQNNPDQVVALEVWLFDKTDEKNVGSQTRVLLSEYAIDHNLEQAFTKERQDDPRPFTAQPNTRFQLESQNLLLDCTITETIYVPSGPTKGIFQSVKVEMAVYKKG